MNEISRLNGIVRKESGRVDLKSSMELRQMLNTRFRNRC